MASQLGCKYYDVHTGQKICYAGAELTICHTVTDHLPVRKMATFNNSSLALFIEIGNKQIFIGGDIEKAAADIIMKIYAAEDLKCDIVQVCHHGYHGGSSALYAAIDANIALWPANQQVTIKSEHRKGNICFPCRCSFLCAGKLAVYHSN